MPKLDSGDARGTRAAERLNDQLAGERVLADQSAHQLDRLLEQVVLAAVAVSHGDRGNVDDIGPRAAVVVDQLVAGPREYE